ncbi:MAG: hypothetical protein HYZ44_02820 [Bacteroidetes bacterium]|nr:hypothetical protein [Bacteroidota bacterium]
MSCTINYLSVLPLFGTAKRLSVRGYRSPEKMTAPAVNTHRSLLALPNISGGSTKSSGPYNQSFCHSHTSLRGCHRLPVASHQDSVGIHKPLVHMPRSFCKSHRHSVATPRTSVANHHIAVGSNESFILCHRSPVASHETTVAIENSFLKAEKAFGRMNTSSPARDPYLVRIAQPNHHAHV